MPFGGAGPLHAAALAEGLGMSRILCPRVSGVLCALGLAAAAPRKDVSRTVMLWGDSLSCERLAEERQALIGAASEGLGEAPARVRVRHELRYRGQSFELAVDESRPADPDALREDFARAHELRYGYRDDSAAVELVTVRVSAWGPAPAPALAAAARGSLPEHGRERGRVLFDGEALDAEILRGDLAPGTRLDGPAVCAMPETTLLIPPQWSGEVDASGSVRLHRCEGAR
jgi:N-methylhydantoinase A